MSETIGPRCEECDCEMTGEESCTIEAYEETGLILCDDCFEDWCENQE